MTKLNRDDACHGGRRGEAGAAFTDSATLRPSVPRAPAAGKQGGRYIATRRSPRHGGTRSPTVRRTARQFPTILKQRGQGCIMTALGGIPGKDKCGPYTAAVA